MEFSSFSNLDSFHFFFFWSLYLVDMEKGSVSVTYNQIVVRGKAIADLIAEMYEDEEESISNIGREKNYYKDVVDVAIKMHDALKKASCCPCAGSTNSKKSKNACFVATPRLIHTRRRGKHVVIPAVGFFDSDDTKAIFRYITHEDRKGGKNRGLDIDERNLCLVSLYEDEEAGTTVFRHHTDVVSVAVMSEARFVVYPYTQAVAREVWSDVEGRFRDEENDAEEDRVYWSEKDKYAKKPKNGTLWAGVDVYGLWPALEQWIPRELGDTLYSSSLTSSSRQTESSLNTKRKRKTDLSDHLDDIHRLNILRDSVVLNALRIPDLVKIRGLHIPAEAVRIREEADTELECSIYFFDTAAEAQTFARRYGLYMGAHDIHFESGAKQFFVSSSMFGAYENIRLGECASPPRGMYEKGHDRKMAYSHECLLPERPTKLYLDVDIKVEEAKHFLPYEHELGQHRFTWDIVDRITLSVIAWFNGFFRRVFGTRLKADDWVVLCACDLDRKMSRHFVLAKPGCFFRSKLDLMMFMDMAQFQLNREMATRNRSLDFSFWKPDIQRERKVPNNDPLAWMTKMEFQQDPVTKAEIKSERSIIDFGVYSDFSFMRGIYCCKMSDPGRVLNNVFVDSGPLKDPYEDPMNKLGKEGVGFIVEHASRSFPRSEESIDMDFDMWKRASIQCIEGPEGPEGPGVPGYGKALPLGTMFPRVKNIKVDQDMLKGDEFVDGFDFKNVVMSFNNQCWWKTSTVPEGERRRFVESLLSSMLNRSSTVSGVNGYGGSLRSLAYSKERVEPGNTAKDCPYKMLRAYFAQVNPPQVERIIDIKPWASCDKILLTRNRDVRSAEEIREIERIKQEAYVSTLPEHKRRRYQKRNMTSQFYSTSTKSTKERAIKTKGSKQDHVRVNFKGTKWCPIAMKDHRSGGRVYLKIYRNGDVVCRCFSDNCKTIASDHGQSSTYRKLYPLDEAQKKVLWG